MTDQIINQTSVSSKQICDVLSGALNCGDTIMVHSSLNSIGWFEGGINVIIDAFERSIGKSGNIIMPTATTSFSKTKHYDVRTTPSEAGTLSEVFRKMPNVSRSCVPMASFAAMGPDSKELTQKYDCYLDAESPFTKFFQLNGKIVLFGVDYNKCTIYHLSEERLLVESDHYKTFSGIIIDRNGNSYYGSQRYFVRKDMNTKKDARMVGKCFEKDVGIIKRRLGNGTIRIFSACMFDDYCMQALKKDRNVFLKHYNDDLFVDQIK